MALHRVQNSERSPKLAIEFLATVGAELETLCVGSTDKRQWLSPSWLHDALRCCRRLKKLELVNIDLGSLAPLLQAYEDQSSQIESLHFHKTKLQDEWSLDAFFDALHSSDHPMNLVLSDLTFGLYVNKLDLEIPSRSLTRCFLALQANRTLRRCIAVAPTVELHNSNAEAFEEINQLWQASGHNPRQCVAFLSIAASHSQSIASLRRLDRGLLSNILAFAGPRRSCQPLVSTSCSAQGILTFRRSPQVPMAPMSLPTQPRAQDHDIVLLEEADLYYYRNPTVPPVNASSQPPLQSTASHSGADTRSQHSGASVAERQSVTFTPHQTRSKKTASVDLLPSYYGAIRPGGAIDLFGADYIGLLLNWVIIGFFNSAAPGILVKVIYYYLGMQGYQADAALALNRLASNFKVALGFLTDAVSINRQRRKPFMYIGWSLLAAFMLFMAVMPPVEPFIKNGEIHNATASSQGPRYVIPLMFASFALLLATVAAEGIMVEVAHLEGDYDRGRAQCQTIAARFLGEFLGSMFATLSLNSADFGGAFAYAVPLSVVFTVCAAVALVGVFVTKQYLHEAPLATSRQRLSSQMRTVWRFVEQRATWQMMGASFLLAAGPAFQIVDMTAVMSDWIRADPFVVSVVASVYRLFVVGFVALFLRFMLNASWRLTVVVSLVGSHAVMLVGQLLTVFDVSRSQSCWLFWEYLGALLSRVTWLTPLLIAVEVTEPGYEATGYGLFTTAANVGSSVMVLTKNFVIASYSPEMRDLKADTQAVRMHVATGFFIKFGVALVMSLAVWPMLPRQKMHLKEIKALGRPNILIPIVLYAIFLALFAVALTSMLLAVSPTTACLTFAGGRGCDATK
ncbi:hypothetical protein P43SY_010342 [Pythium insidiosum]|uniref:Transmembrane protein n=1 Tax=Pythium insidiosum TaxID=114742 RepID=A0AAD5Q3C8_PYTIN|nr:hypothetical protein P43SY_010342 [Pythium insidiosum]